MSSGFICYQKTRLYALLLSHHTPSSLVELLNDGSAKQITSNVVDGTNSTVFMHAFFFSPLSVVFSLSLYYFFFDEIHPSTLVLAQLYKRMSYTFSLFSTSTMVGGGMDLCNSHQGIIEKNKIKKGKKN
jgi:hypothetical protein